MKPIFAIVFFVTLLSSRAYGASFSFGGTFTQDDNVVLLNFSVTSMSTVTLQTLSYAGGVNSAGTVVPEGGFDPILSLFDGTGMLLASNDDGDTARASSVTGEASDAMLQTTLTTGTYTVALTEFDNFANGPNLSNGFFEGGNGNFTSSFGCTAGKFCDTDQYSRTANWAIDLLNVSSATNLSAPPSAAPEPATTSLLIAGLGAIALRVARRSR